MIHGIGVDIVKVERMRAGLQRFGHRFSRRILVCLFSMIFVYRCLDVAGR